MKKLLLILIFSVSVLPVFAKHITGGEILYDYLGPGASSSSKLYRITLRLFRDENTIGGAALPPAVRLGIFNNDGNSLVGYRDIAINSSQFVPIISVPNCLTNDPNLSYTVGYYIFQADLPNNGNGYTITYQTCCRVDGITNIGFAEGIGAAYTGTIPGSNTLGGGTDNSARFTTGISIICQDKPFTLDFSATDPDAGDVIEYRLDYAYNGGNIHDAGLNNNPAPPPYGSIPYSSPYSALSPLGPTATLNSSTGIISGVAPAAGFYVVCVTAYSYRNGIVVATHRKDFIIRVAECDFVDADLNPGVFTSCDGFTKTFQNTTVNPSNLTFDWDFGDPVTGTLNVSTDEVATHTFSAPGDYTIRLIVNINTECSDTAFAVVKVYPGFFPGFAPIPPMCKDLPVQFTDITTANFGVPSYWSWTFGDETTLADTSHIRNPTYTYNTAGTYNVEFIVETSVGCRDTLYPQVTIVDRPDFRLPNDTLICIVDTIPLIAATTALNGTITWSPDYMISDIHSFTPLVSPDITTTYTALFTDQFGCSATESVVVTVTNGVTLIAANDTTICRTDNITLAIPSTNGLYFHWTATPTAPISDPDIRNPIATPTAPTTVFSIRSSISAKCFSDDEIVVKTVPYPVPAVTGNDPVCFGMNSQLNASGGSSYTWIPTTYLSNPNIANPVSLAPKLSLTYTVSVRDTLGCPKPVTKDFTVRVIKIVANAGPQDTSIVLDQPLQLQATGSNTYSWTPATWLDNPNIANPISNPRNNITYTVRVSNEIGCFALDTINVKVYFIPPDVYVPSAFTPGGDALNDLFRPVALGIKSLEYFRVYNRWGEMVYATNKISDGWNGIYKGATQPPATYVWEVSATDFRNKKIKRKGSVILIR